MMSTNSTMTWNYRVIHHSEFEIHSYNIHEVYYENDIPHSCTEDPCSPWGETAAEFRSDIDAMLKAFDLPVLEYDNFTDKGYTG